MAEKQASGLTNRTRGYVLVLLATALLAAGLYFSNPHQDENTIVVTFPSGSKIRAEVADTPEKLLFGLAFRESLPPNGGMLYIFDKSDRHEVWTKAFQMPVDIIWADESRHVVHIVEGAEPCDKEPCPWYGPPPTNARYVIETHAGFVRRENLRPGAELSFALQL